jgi:hypothetical protein
MWVRTIIVGAVTGIIFYELTLIIGRYIIDPVACRQVINAALCTDSTPMAGNIATILVAVVGVVAMVRMNIARPIITGVAAAALLWDLASWTEGLFWLEAIAWTAILYAGAYSLFGWIIRHEKLWVTLALSALIVLVIRIALVL